MNVISTIIEQDRRFLLLQYANGKWNFPWGIIKDGEPLADASRRTVHDIANITLHASSVKLIDLIDMKTDLIVIYNARATNQIPVIQQPAHHLKAEWKTAQEIINLAGQHIGKPARNYMESVALIARAAQPSITQR